MRGKPLWSSRRGLTSRITPAGAGKTEAERENIESYKDHPRRCGENKFWPCGHTQNAGSPPQVRGKQFDFGVDRSNNRITPAGAGKTINIC